MSKNALKATGEAMPSGHPRELSFVASAIKGGGFNYWAVEPTGNYGTDCAKGRELGGEYLDFLGTFPTNGNATLLGCIVGSMIEQAVENGRNAKGLEIGFLAHVNEYALAAARLVQLTAAARASELPALLIEAIAAETVCFRDQAGALGNPDPAISDAAQALADAAIANVNAIERALLDAPTEETGEDYVRAMALSHKRWLVMEGSFQDANARIECRLVDAILAGTRFDDVPLLWHLSGQPRDERPTDAEFQAGWEA